jgi:hypothetical protein
MWGCSKNFQVDDSRRPRVGDTNAKKESWGSQSDNMRGRKGADLLLRRAPEMRAAIAARTYSRYLGDHADARGAHCS